MKNYKQSDIFQKMDKNDVITNTIKESIKNIGPQTILNPYLGNLINSIKGVYKDSSIKNITEAIENNDIIVCAFRLDQRFPANMPFVKVKKPNGKNVVIVDLSKYAVITREDNGDIKSVTCDITKLYSLVLPALASLKVFNEELTPSVEIMKDLSLLWANMFNKVLKSQRVFIASEERYEAFMYFAMKFFLKYYAEMPEILIDKITDEFLNNTKSQYIQFVEENLDRKGINLYQDWRTFAATMFSNEITNINTLTGGTQMTVEQYIKLFATYMGRDGAYIALWSIDYFFYCVFCTQNKAYILNDRSWEDVVGKNNKSYVRLLSSIFRHL